MNFDKVLIALKEGKRATRASWSCGLFVFMQIPSEIHKENVPGMQSLPKLVKDEFKRRFDDLGFNHITYKNQFALVNDLNLITGWLPSPIDLIIDDWIILD